MFVWTGSVLTANRCRRMTLFVKIRWAAVVGKKYWRRRRCLFDLIDRAVDLDRLSRLYRNRNRSRNRRRLINNECTQLLQPIFGPARHKSLHTTVCKLQAGCVQPYMGPTPLDYSVIVGVDAGMQSVDDLHTTVCRLHTMVKCRLHASLVGRA